MASSDGVPRAVKFATAGVGGVFGWVVVHPFNTAAVRMNLAASQPGYQRTGFLSFAARTASERGVRSFYDGLGAGCLRQVFYATSRFGLFETFRDAIAERRRVGPAERVAAGLASGACAALLSCPAEVALVRALSCESRWRGRRRRQRTPRGSWKKILHSRRV